MSENTYGRLTEKVKRAQQLMREFEEIQFDWHAWPGMYPLVYFCDDGDALCAHCAKHPDFVLDIVSVDPHLEGPAIQCDHCGRWIESAYGDPDDEAEE